MGPPLLGTCLWDYPVRKGAALQWAFLFLIAQSTVPESLLLDFCNSVLLRPLLVTQSRASWDFYHSGNSLVVDAGVIIRA